MLFLQWDELSGLLWLVGWIDCDGNYNRISGVMDYLGYYGGMNGVLQEYFSGGCGKDVCVV